MAEARLPQLRRPRRADRAHAPRAGRAPALDLREALPARAQLLHAAARPRGAAARDLHRLADAPHARRHRGGRALRPAVARDPDRAVVALRRVRRRAGDRRRVLRHQACGDGDRRLRRVPARLARADERLDLVDRRARVRRRRAWRAALPARHRLRGGDRLRRRQDRSGQVLAARRPRRGEGVVRAGGDRRRHADAAARASSAASASRACCSSRSALWGGAIARSDACLRQRRRADEDGLVLHPGRAAHLRRRVRGAAVRLPGRGRAAPLADRGPDDRRPRPRRIDARAADHGRRLRRLRRRLDATPSSAAIRCFSPAPSPPPW